MEPPVARSSDPVTVVARRRIRQGREAEYEAWLSRLIAAATADAPGFLGAEVLRPAVRELVEGDAVWERMTGLELWFTPPPGTVVPQPSRFRMALLLIVVVYVLVLSIGNLVALALADWPVQLRLFLTIAIEVFVMTYLVMPHLTKWLARWIYPTTKTR